MRENRERKRACIGEERTINKRELILSKKIKKRLGGIIHNLK
jgi:hypothetical protein